MALRRPTLSENLSANLTQLPAGDYRYAERLPAGAVVVVGANGSGAEIAEGLHLDLSEAGVTSVIWSSHVDEQHAATAVSVCNRWLRLPVGDRC